MRLEKEKCYDFLFFVVVVVAAHFHFQSKTPELFVFLGGGFKKQKTKKQTNSQPLLVILQRGPENELFASLSG